MVSKTPTRKPSPSPPRRRSPRAVRRRPPSPLRRLAASLVRTTRPCIRRLATAFSKLSPAPASRLRRTARLRLLKSLQDTHPLLLDTAPLLHPDPLRRPTAFLDLDETLIHSTPDPPPPRYDFEVCPTIGGTAMKFYVLKRPGLDRFLAEAARAFELVVFTAGLREYASLVLKRLDPAGALISQCLYRDSCREIGGRLVKDLAAVGGELPRVVIFDDNPGSYALQPENAVPVRPFVDDMSDRELDRLTVFFDIAEHYEDIREAVRAFRDILEEKEEEETKGNNS